MARGSLGPSRPPLEQLVRAPLGLFRDGNGFCAQYFTGSYGVTAAVAVKPELARPEDSALLGQFLSAFLLAPEVAVPADLALCVQSRAHKRT